MGFLCSIGVGGDLTDAASDSEDSDANAASDNGFGSVVGMILGAFSGVLFWGLFRRNLGRWLSCQRFRDALLEVKSRSWLESLAVAWTSANSVQRSASKILHLSREKWLACPSW